jgi:hypothetical protein
MKVSVKRIFVTRTSRSVLLEAWRRTLEPLRSLVVIHGVVGRTLGLGLDGKGKGGV